MNLKLIFEITGIVIMLVIIFLWLRSYVIEPEESIEVSKIKYTTNPDLSTEDDFINYMHIFAKENNIPFLPHENVQNFFIQNIGDMRVNYVFQTGNMLAIYNVPEFIKKAVISYIE